MKAKNKTTLDQIFLILNDINTQYPNQGIMRHIVDATVDYKSNLWMLSDKEFLFALNKYKLESEINVTPDIEIDKIVADAQDLNTILDKPDQDEMFNIDELESWIA